MTDEVVAAKRKIRDAKAELRYVKHLQETRAEEQRQKDVYTSGTWHRDKVISWLLGNASGVAVYVVLALVIGLPSEAIIGGVVIGFVIYNVGWMFFAFGVTSGRKYERHNRQGLS